MSNRLAVVSAEDVDLVVEVFDGLFIEGLITFKEAMVVGNV